jgi:hypothetical protein
MVFCESCNIEKKDGHNKTLKHLVNTSESVVGIVYKYTKDSEEYIGSTFNVHQRNKAHNSNINLYNTKFYKHIRENNLKLEDFYYEVIETFEIVCKNRTVIEVREELRMYEQNYIDIVKPSLNTQGSYCEDDSIYKIKYRQSEAYKKFLERNREKENKRCLKKYYDNYEKYTFIHNCECGGKYRINHKSRHYKSKKHRGIA